MMAETYAKFARIRVDVESARLLYDILHEERGRLIEEKISLRETGDEPMASTVRRELSVINDMMDEVLRALGDLNRPKLEEAPRGQG